MVLNSQLSCSVFTVPLLIGYRKIPGDVCQGGDNHKYDKIQRNCPNNDKVDFLIYSVGTSIYK